MIVWALIALFAGSVLTPVFFRRRMTLAYWLSCFLLGFSIGRLV